MFLNIDWSALVASATFREYASVLGSVVVGALLIKGYAVILSRRLKVLAERTESKWDDIAVHILDRSVTPMVLATSLYIITHALVSHPLLQRVGEYAWMVVFTWFLAEAIIRFFDHAAENFLLKRSEADEPPDPTIHQNVRFVVRLIVWIVGAFLVLSNLGYNITSLVAGLGIGGIAVALAIQNILGDLFSYITILVDKPFVIGDFIVAGPDMGEVERIGIKSTRLRTLAGPELIISNRDLTSARVQNFRHMIERRIVFGLNLAYDTPMDKLRRVPELVTQIMAAIADIRLDRVHLKSLGSDSLHYEIAYFFPAGHEYNDYLGTQERINLAVLERFRAEEIVFAFPTQTLELKRR